MVQITKLPPAEQDVFFQEEQFDPDIPRGSAMGGGFSSVPIGTSHIDRQGEGNDEYNSGGPIAPEEEKPGE